MKINHCNRPYKPKKKTKPHNHLNRHRESIWQKQTPFYENTPQNMRNRRGLFSPDKEPLWKFRTSILLNGKRLKAFPLTSGTRQLLPLKSIIAISSRHFTGGSSQHILAIKWNKRPQIGKEKVKLSLFVENVIMNVKNANESLKAIRANTQVQQGCGYKINIQKTIVFL